MSQELTKLFAAIKEAEEQSVAKSAAVNDLPAKHQMEREDAKQQAETAFMRKLVLDETLRLVIHEDMTIEQAKMIAHDVPHENLLRRFR